MPRPITITRRPARPGDRAFLLAVYSSTRERELALVPWSDEQKRAFCEMQFNAQDLDYHRNYPDATYEVIVVNGQPAGRLYVGRWPDEIRIVDITLMAQFRGQGIGTRLLQELQAEAATAKKLLRIHVERENPALRLYQRLGFHLLEEKDVYLFLEWSPERHASR